MDYTEIMGYVPSEYQEKVFDFVLHGYGNGVIKAVAGSGKTTVLVAAMKLVPKRKKCLFIAFNKRIVEELESRLKGYPNCSVKTIHSLGFQVVRQNVGHEIELDDYKYRTYVKQHLSELSGISKDVPLQDKAVLRYIDNICSLIDFARYNCAQSAEEIRKIADNYNIPLSYDECDVVVKCMEWGRTHLETVDYTDMVWLPHELSMKPMGCKFDWIFADEAQDFSLMATDLFYRCFKRGTRYIAVGDPDQSINMFAGASPEAFDTLCEYRNTQVFDLPITYRCAKSIVDIARHFSPKTVARENAPEGQIINTCYIRELKGDDMVLSRARFPIVQLYGKLLRRKIPCYINGSEIGADLLALLQDVVCETELLNAEMREDGIFVRLYDFMFSERQSLMNKKNIDSDDATLSAYIMRIYDNIESLLSLSYGLKTRAQLIERLNVMLNETNKGICLSTVHKAKGLEADRVFILCPSSMPSPLAKKDWEVRQERNVQYVAYTRARNVLGFMSEVENPPMASSLTPERILEDVRNIEMNVCRILGKEPTENIPSLEFTRFKVSHATDVDAIVKATHNCVTGLFKLPS